MPICICVKEVLHNDMISSGDLTVESPYPNRYAYMKIKFMLKLGVTISVFVVMDKLNVIVF